MVLLNETTVESNCKHFVIIQSRIKNNFDIN